MTSNLASSEFHRRNFKYYLVTIVVIFLLSAWIVNASTTTNSIPNPTTSTISQADFGFCNYSWCVFPYTTGGTTYYCVQAGQSQSVYSNGVIAYGCNTNSSSVTGTNASQVLKTAFTLGGSILVENGTYPLTGSGYIPTVTKPFTSIIGSGRVLISRSSNYSGFFIQISASNVTVSGIQITGYVWATAGEVGWTLNSGASSGYSQKAIYIAPGANYVTIINDRFYNTGYSIFVNSADSSTPVIGTIITDNYFYGVTQGPICWSRCYGFQVIGNFFFNTYDDAIAIQGGCCNYANEVPSYGTIIADNYINKNGPQGAAIDLAAEGGHIFDTTITGNVIYNTLTGIYFWDQSNVGTIPSTQLPDYVIISGNYINANITLPGVGGNYRAIRLWSIYNTWSVNATITGNNIAGPQSGIELENVSNVLISGNSLIHTTTAAMYNFEVVDSTNVTATGNYVSGCGSSIYIDESDATTQLANIVWNGNTFTCPRGSPGTFSLVSQTNNPNYFLNNFGYNYGPGAVSPRSVTAGTSVWTYTDQDGYPESVYLTATNGISAETCDGFTVGDSLGQVCELQPLQTMTVTWATTAPMFEVQPSS